MSEHTAPNFQCELLEEAKKKLAERNIKRNDNYQCCDCNNKINFPTSSCQFLQEEHTDIDDTVMSDDFDFLHSSTKSMPLMDQPGKGACVLTAAEK